MLARGARFDHPWTSLGRSSQRWGAPAASYFYAPCSLDRRRSFGDEVIEFEYAGLKASRETMGHRFMAPGPFAVADADKLLEVVRAAKVVPSHAQRETLIREQVSAIEAETGLKAELPQKTLVEVVNLAEYPTAMVGAFDEEFLAVPEEIIVDAMLMHQRYFPLYDAQGKLSNKFIVVSNGDPAFTETIVDGNERVVRARLYDAKFFYDEDLKKPLEAYVPTLDEVVFQEKLGTVLDKTNRIDILWSIILLQKRISMRPIGLTPSAQRIFVRLTSLRMRSWNSPRCRASWAPTMPRQQGRLLKWRVRSRSIISPSSLEMRLPMVRLAASLVAFADKLDTICGLFAIDQGPSGSSDPFAIRRSAIGIVNMLNAGLPVNLTDAIACALDNYTNISFDKAAVQTQIEDFFITRARVMCQDAGQSPDVIEAVLAGGVREPAEFTKRVSVLERFRAEHAEEMQDLSTAFARANNLRDEEVGIDLDEAALGEVEIALRDATDTASAKVTKALAAQDYEGALRALAALRVPIDTFFDEVMIMDDDPVKRANRLALLNRFVSVFSSVADFSHLVKQDR